MFRKKKHRKISDNQKGTTLMEVIVGIGLVGMLTISLYMSLFQAIRLMSDAKQRVGAVSLATESMESFRNLSYENIPIIDPSQSTIVVKNGYTYQVDTLVMLVDDPENGLGSDEDYKQVHIEVSWTSGEQQQEILFVNNFSSGGISHRTVMVFTYDGDSYSPLGGASVQLDEISGGTYSDSKLTNESSGRALFFEGLNENGGEYQVTLSKSGHETVKTYDPDDPSVSFDPINKSIVLIDGSDAALRYFPLRQTSDLTIKARDEEGTDLPGVEIELKGGQKIGNDPDAYSYDDTGSPQTTDSVGEIKYQNSENLDSKMSPGDYSLVNINNLEKEGYEFVGIAEDDYPFFLAAGANDTWELIFVDEIKNSLLVKVTDSEDGALIRNASVRVFNSDSSYNETVVSDSLGFSFFRFDDAGLFEELVASDYEIEILVDDYENGQLNTTVSGFGIENAILVPVPDP